MIRDRSVDAAATDARRGEIADQRIVVTLGLADEEMTDGPRRQFSIPQELARKLGVSEGHLVELVTGRGAPIRAWACISGDGEAVAVSSTSLDIMGAAPGDRVRMRATISRPETVA